MTIRITTLFVLVCGLVTGLVAQDTSSPAGRWMTIDDETGETKSIVEISEQNGKFTGRIVELMRNKDATCTECSGKRKNQPINGMVIIENLTAKDDYWAGGTILDPKKGSEYKLSAWYEGDADVLFIRGKHWTGLYRTQTWKRAK